MDIPHKLATSDYKNRNCKQTVRVLRHWPTDVYNKICNYNLGYGYIIINILISISLDKYIRSPCVHAPI